jgi:hypothetical protein
MIKRPEKTRDAKIFVEGRLDYVTINILMLDYPHWHRLRIKNICKIKWKGKLRFREAANLQFQETLSTADLLSTTFIMDPKKKIRNTVTKWQETLGNFYKTFLAVLLWTTPSTAIKPLRFSRKFVAGHRPNARWWQSLCVLCVRIWPLLCDGPRGVGGA